MPRGEGSSFLGQQGLEGEPHFCAWIPTVMHGMACPAPQGLQIPFLSRTLCTMFQPAHVMMHQLWPLLLLHTSPPVSQGVIVAGEESQG